MREHQITQAWSEFVREAIGDLPNKVVAERIDVSDSTVGNWVRGSNFSQPDGKLVVRFARIFGRPLAAALVAAGYGEENEYRETVLTMRDASTMTDDEIVDAMDKMVAEIRRRRNSRPQTNPESPPL